MYPMLTLIIHVAYLSLSFNFVLNTCRVPSLKKNKSVAPKLKHLCSYAVHTIQCLSELVAINDGRIHF